MERLKVSDWSQPIKLILMGIALVELTYFGLTIIALLSIIANK